MLGSSGRDLAFSVRLTRIIYVKKCSILSKFLRDYFTMSRPLVYGHRGMGCSLPGTLSLFPENSITSFREARRIGADGIELDVFLSKNNELLVLHGYTSKNCLNLTTLGSDGASGVKLLTENDLVETTDLRAQDLKLKKPWRLLQNFLDIDDILNNHRKNITASFQSYLNNLEQADTKECVPTLEQVFTELGDTVKYDIELKGSNTNLGLRVLEVLEKFPELDVVISSFQWLPPELDKNSPHYNQAVEQLPNGKDVVDLLRPLVNNRLGIPLALLFNNETSELPSIDRIVECVNHYGAKWVSLSHDFWKTENPIVGAGVKGKDAVSHLVSELHEKGIKTMTYFLESTHDTEEDINVQLESGLDAICPNDVQMCLKLLRK
ncbi:glycerophosphoryl diester phosphodiesterase [Babesia ovis]|uniref:Glycerophosphoryl diester phosphodiesterase n=1 Tax=Babesia ovis TaxID=5869 RepID=A0A9W5TB04_BABOV|nr:glycerophosphoryl diester phosphodiesterase [Babesia ovis]